MGSILNNRMRGVVCGSMNGDLFEGWLEHILVPEFNNPAKCVLIVDNASWHKKDAIFDIADEYGFRVIFCPLIHQT